VARRAHTGTATPIESTCFHADGPNHSTVSAMPPREVGWTLRLLFLPPLPARPGRSDLSSTSSITQRSTSSLCALFTYEAVLASATSIRLGHHIHIETSDSRRSNADQLPVGIVTRLYIHHESIKVSTGLPSLPHTASLSYGQSLYIYTIRLDSDPAEASTVLPGPRMSALSQWPSE